MKKFLKICGVLALCVVAVLYLGFLFIVPNVIDLSKYKTDIQQIAAKEAKLNVDFEDLRVYTTPLLKAGVKLDDVSIKMPDETLLFSAKEIKTGISLPSILLLTVNVNDLVVNDPFVNLEIKEGDKFKVMKLVEDIVNTKNLFRLDKKVLQEIIDDENNPEKVKGVATKIIEFSNKQEIECSFVILSSDTSFSCDTSNVKSQLFFVA